MSESIITDEGVNELWDKLLIGLLKVNHDGTILAANSAACALTEYSEAELKTKKTHGITHPDDSIYDKEMMEDVLLGKKDGYDMPKRCITKFGKVVPILSRSIVVREQTGEFMYFLFQIPPLHLTHGRLSSTDLQSMFTNMAKAERNKARRTFWQFIKDYQGILMFMFAGLVAFVGYILGGLKLK